MTNTSTAFSPENKTRHAFSSPAFQVRMAHCQVDVLAAQRLRYEVFVEELGADGPLVDHLSRRERDRYDPFFDHLVLVDPARPDGSHVVGVYRMMQEAGAQRAGQFYSEDEFDLSVLRTSGRRLLELGRSCVHADYRGGTAMYHLWNGLAAYIQQHRIEVLFGVASFRGTDPQALRQPLAYLHHHHRSPPELRVRSRALEPMNLMPAAALDRSAALRATPALIKAYLRLGGHVGEGAFIDHSFNTTDVCLVLDTAQMNPRQRDLYTKSARR